MPTQMDVQKRVFLSATYEDQVDCIEEIISKLNENGINVIQFTRGGFPDGRIGVHPHDVCLENVENTPNYIIIVGYKAGADYEGVKPDYCGLTVTHAEFRTAYEASVKDDNRRSFFFVRQKIVDTYSTWKSLNSNGKEAGKWPAEQKVYRLLKDFENKNIYRVSFTDSLNLKEHIVDTLQHLAPESIDASDEIINIDTIASYIRTNYPERPPTPQQDLIIVTLELGRYGCQTISELDTKLKQAKRAFAELDKEFRQHEIKGIHGGGVIRNSLWILDDKYYEKKITGFIAEQLIDRKRFREFI